MFCTVSIQYRIKPENIHKEYTKLVADVKNAITRELANGSATSDPAQFANRVINSALNSNKFSAAVNGCLKSKFDISQVKDWYDDDNEEDDD